MASRGSKKNSVKPDKKAVLAAELNDKWRKNAVKFAVVVVILLVLAVVFSMPFSWNGTVSVKSEGTLSMDVSGPLYDLIASGTGSDSGTSTEISVSLPANPWMVVFAPTFCNGGDTFLLVEMLTGLGYEFDAKAGYLDNPFELDAQLEGMLDSAGIALYVISVMVILALIAMVVVCIIAVTGKLGAKAAFIASLVFTALALVQFIFGIVACSTRIPAIDGGTVTVMPGAFMIVSLILGAAISAVTGVWMKKCDKARAEYLELQAEIDKK